jgi:hypothetical protein
MNENNVAWLLGVMTGLIILWLTAAVPQPQTIVCECDCE